MSKNIALIGSAPSSVRLAPYGNPEWDIWACSPGAWPVAGDHAHVWFEMHRWEPGQDWMSHEYCKFLENFKGQVITSEPVASVKNNRQMDINYLVEKYGPYFFTSSLSWMFAMAIEAGAEKIGLWGVDMAATEEYGYQRAGCQYFATLARALGIEVGVPPESDLLRPSPLYGICETSHNWIKATARQRELTERLDRAKQQYAHCQQEMQFLQGALDDQQWNMQTWFGHTDTQGRGYIEPPLVPMMAPVIQAPPKPVKKKRKKAAKKQGHLKDKPVE